MHEHLEGVLEEQRPPNLQLPMIQNIKLFVLNHPINGDERSTLRSITTELRQGLKMDITALLVVPLRRIPNVQRLRLLSDISTKLRLHFLPCGCFSPATVTFIRTWNNRMSHTKY